MSQPDLYKGIVERLDAQESGSLEFQGNGISGTIGYAPNSASVRGGKVLGGSCYATGEDGIVYHDSFKIRPDKIGNFGKIELGDSTRELSGLPQILRETLLSEKRN